MEGIRNLSITDKWSEEDFMILYYIWGSTFGATTALTY